MNPAISRLLIYIIILLMQVYMSLKTGDNIVQEVMKKKYKTILSIKKKFDYGSQLNIIYQSLIIILLRRNLLTSGKINILLIFTNIQTEYFVC